MPKGQCREPSCVQTKIQHVCTWGEEGACQQTSPWSLLNKTARTALSHYHRLQLCNRVKKKVLRIWDLTLDYTYQGQRVQDRKHTASLGQQWNQHRERRREISKKEKTSWAPWFIIYYYFNHYIRNTGMSTSSRGASFSKVPTIKQPPPPKLSLFIFKREVSVVLQIIW